MPTTYIRLDGCTHPCMAVHIYRNGCSLHTHLHGCLRGCAPTPACVAVHLHPPAWLCTYTRLRGCAPIPACVAAHLPPGLYTCLHGIAPAHIASRTCLYARLPVRFHAYLPAWPYARLLYVWISFLPSCPILN
jgi:hypothetical protein